MGRIAGPLVDLEPLQEVLAAAARQAVPITLQVTGLGVTEEYFRTLFVAFADDPALRRLYDAVKGALACDAGYRLEPHLSLLYAELPLAAKEMAARTIGLDRDRIRFDELQIVTPENLSDGWRDTKRWRILFRVRLGEKPMREDP